MVTSHLKSQKIVPEDRPAGPFPGKDSPSSQISNPFCVCQCQDEILESFVSWDLACKSLCINSICRWSEPAGCLTWLHGDTFGHKGAPRVFLQFTGVLGNRWDLRSRGLLLHISMMFCLFNEVYRIQSCWRNLLSNDISWHTHRIHDVYYMVDFIITIIYHYLPTIDCNLPSKWTIHVSKYTLRHMAFLLRFTQGIGFVSPRWTWTPMTRCRHGGTGLNGLKVFGRRKMGCLSLKRQEINGYIIVP